MSKHPNHPLPNFRLKRVRRHETSEHEPSVSTEVLLETLLEASFQNELPQKVYIVAAMYLGTQASPTPFKREYSKPFWVSGERGSCGYAVTRGAPTFWPTADEARLRALRALPPSPAYSRRRVKVFEVDILTGSCYAVMVDTRTDYEVVSSPSTPNPQD